jgi:hypothetical protein
MFLRLFSCFACVVWLCACPSPQPGPSDGGSDGGADVQDAGALDGLCVRQRVDSRGVVICEQLHATAPLIRPPADTATSVYVGFGSTSSGFQMIGRARTWTPPTGFSGLIEGDGTGAGVPYGSSLYRATVSGDTVTGLVIVARVEEPLFLQHFAGRALEGGLSVRMDGGAGYDFTNLSLPVRVQLDAAPTDAGTLVGHILNVSSGVRASTGACLPALTTYGEHNPLVGVSPDPGRLEFQRTPDMHGGYDDVVVMNWSSPSLGNTMTPVGYVSVPDLLKSTPLDVSAFGGGVTHGTPNSAPSASELMIAGDGGVACP